MREGELSKERALREVEVAMAREATKSAMLEQFFNVTFHGDFESFRKAVKPPNGFSASFKG